MVRVLLLALLSPAVVAAFVSHHGGRFTLSATAGTTSSQGKLATSHLRATPTTRATSALQMSKKTAVSRDQDLAQLLQWAREDIGVKVPLLKGGFVDGLRGLVATQNIRPNDEVVIVPSESALVTTTDQRCPFPEWVNQDFWAKSPWQGRLALLLLREKQKESESKLHPWISRLPESFGTPVDWPAADLSELQYPHLEAAAREQREEWANLHASLKASSPGCAVTEAELSWAMGVAYSRAFSGPYEGRGPKERLAEVAFVAALAGGSVGLGLGTPDQVANGALAVLVGIPIRDFLMTKLVQLKRYALTPVVDLINHSSAVESDVSYNYFYGYFAVTTQRGWEAGEQVFISYGPRSNDHLLQRYGFVEANNPNDVYRITGLVDKLSALLGEDSVKVLRGSGTALGPEVVDSATVGREGLAGEKEEARVMPALRLAVVKDDQLPDGKAGEISLKDFKKEISPANESAARRALRELCIKEREGFATELDQDERSMSSLGKTLGANKRSALTFRMEKKRVLNAAIAAMRNDAAANGDNKTAVSSSKAVTA